MPLLHLDLDDMAKAVPDGARAKYAALPVADRLSLMAALGPQIHSASARAALRIMATPQYVGLDAVRVTLQVAARLTRAEPVPGSFLPAAASSTDRTCHRQHSVVQWRRHPEERWRHQITALDLKEVATLCKLGLLNPDSPAAGASAVLHVQPAERDQRC